MAYKLDQGGLGMPNRDYYFDTDEKTTAVRKAYKNYLLKTFQQLGNDAAAAKRCRYPFLTWNHIGKKPAINWKTCVTLTKLQ